MSVVALTLLLVLAAAPGDDLEPTAAFWSQRPAAEYPASALSQDIVAGDVRLSCFVVGDRRLSGCQILSETPPGFGFGDAAMKAVSTAQISPAALAQAPEDRRVAFTIRFRLF